MTRDWEIIAGLKVGMIWFLRPFASIRLTRVRGMGNRPVDRLALSRGGERLVLKSALLAVPLPPVRGPLDLVGEGAERLHDVNQLLVQALALGLDLF
jgi:hypothetical protein